MDKLVSIIVPIYNVEKYLRKCIDSILKQTYKELEIILVDDGSSDGCPQICDEYQQKDSRVKVIHKPNGGLSSARNAGIENSSGEYVAFVDSDDVIHERFIEHLYNLCEKYNCQMAQCDFLSIIDGSCLLPPQKKEMISFLDGRELITKCWVGSENVKYTVAWNKLYHKSILRDIRYPEGKMHEDEFTTWRFLQNVNKAAISNLYLYYYLYRTDSIMTDINNVHRYLDLFEAYKIEALFCRKNYMQEEYKNVISRWFNNIKIYLEKLKSTKNYSLGKELALIEKDLQSDFESVLDSNAKSYIINRKEDKEEYIFPFDIVEKNTKIALYGAGNVGKVYYRQIVTTKYCSIEVWVDKMGKFNDEDAIHPLDELLKREYDIVLIALNNEEVAAIVKNDLVSWGIPENKIIWRNPELLSLSDIAAKQKLKNEMKRGIKSTRLNILVNTADHGNLGDHALALVGRSFLEKYFPEIKVVEITGKQWSIFNYDIKELVKSEDIIFVVGGGFMGDVWINEDRRVKDIIKSFHKNKIVFLPQTFFCKKYNYVSEKHFYTNKTNILFIHREKNSFNNFMKNVVSNKEQNKLFPDMVFGMETELYKYEKRHGGLVCLRKDKENIINSQMRDAVYCFCINQGIDIEEIDTAVSTAVSQDERKNKLDTLLDKIGHSRLLITDRLHGMIFAVITGTPCIAFDNMTHKVKGVYEWIKDIPYVICIEENELTAELIETYYNMHECIYNKKFIETYFFNMAESIKKWLKEQEN